MCSFDNDIEVLRHERQENDRIFGKRFERSGNGIYACFCGYCNGEGKTELKKNARAFAKWLKDNGIELDFWQRKAIAENHFGFAYEWNGSEWKIRKNKSKGE